MLKKILIANRGEIASRIIRSCQNFGLETLAVYAPVDRALPFVSEADQAIALPSNDSLQSYCNAPLLLEIAKKYGVDAVHPGYGFLSENADFARACQAEGLVFIGPEPDTLTKMGSKIAARELVTSLGIPVVPGFEGPPSGFATAAQELGYPVLIKASAGGGGRGMRLVTRARDLERAMESAGSEALKAFGDDTLFLEKYLSPVRHIEVQIVGDGKGAVWHLLSRECSLQRRYQKVIEEAPAPELRPETREKLHQWSVQIGEQLRFKSLGTVEFAVDSEEQVYFLECNTRIQVEHPVTEAITGLDLVTLQLQVASHIALDLVQADITPRGHAFECRLYAEDPGRAFAPSTGLITRFAVPKREGYRCDAGIASGSQVSVYFDALLAKLIAHGSSRELARARMERFLKETQIFGVKTNLRFLEAILQNPRLKAGALSTTLISDMGEETSTLEPAVSLAALMAYHHRQSSRRPLTAIRPSFRNLPYRWAQARLMINDALTTLEYMYQRTGELQCVIDDHTYAASAMTCSEDQICFELNQSYFCFAIAWQGEELWLHHPAFGNVKAQSIALLSPPQTQSAQNVYRSQIPGKVLRVLVQAKERIVRNQPLWVIESMKMETQILAQTDGVIAEIYISEGQHIDAGTLCLEVDNI
jgi:acetyl/propionyl-CoA carboxylase alpha subunit